MQMCDYLTFIHIISTSPTPSEVKVSAYIPPLLVYLSFLSLSRFYEPNWTNAWLSFTLTLNTLLSPPCSFCVVFSWRRRMRTVEIAWYRCFWGGRRRRRRRGGGGSRSSQGRMRGESAHEEGPHADGRSRSECGVEEGGGCLMEVQRAERVEWM